MSTDPRPVDVADAPATTLDLDPEPAPQALAPAQPPAPPRRPQVVPPPERRPAVAFERAIVQHSDTIGKLVGALAKAQGAFKDLERTRESRITLKTGGGYTHQYETLADVIAATQEALSANGLAVMQFPFPGPASLTIRTLLAHESGEWIYNDLSATLYGNDPQNVGIGITYLMRYARKAILGISASYDDADGAPQETAPPQAAPRRSAAPPPAREAAAPQAPAAPSAHVSPSNVGKITATDERGGAFMLKLDTGFQAATRNAELTQAAKTFQSQGWAVEVVTRPSSDPAKYAPVIVELLPRGGAGAAAR
jgi:hypothetical protein